jgi:hypothetical protein
MNLLLFAWSVCPGLGGQFAPGLNGQFAPLETVNLFR